MESLLVKCPFPKDSKKYRLLVKYPFRKDSKKYRLLVCHELNNVKTYTSIVEDKTFPQKKFPLTAPEPLRLLTNTKIVDSINGILCFSGDVDSNTKRGVFWNPTVGKSVGINVIPKEGYTHTVVGFGVYDGDPMFVKISVLLNSNGPNLWDVDVFTLSTELSKRGWKNVYKGEAYKKCKLECAKVCENGVIYFRAYDGEHGDRNNFFITFDLKSMKFGEVPLPEDLEDTDHYIQAAKVNGSPGILEYHVNDRRSGMHVCSVWTREDGANTLFTKFCGLWTTKHDANKPFFKKHIVKVEGESLYGNVLGFRNNGDVLIEVDDKDNKEKSAIQVYKPLFNKNKPSTSGLISGVGINGRRLTFSVRSYMETELLLDHLLESDHETY